MFPWLFLFAPQLHFPFSGSVAQRIEPDTRWFFDGIDPSAGDARIERQAFEVASYGRQLGLIAEVLVEQAEQTPPRTKAAREALQRLKQIQADIEQIKTQDAAALARDVEAGLLRLKRLHPADYRALGHRLQRSLADDV